MKATAPGSAPAAQPSTTSERCLSIGHRSNPELSMRTKPDHGTLLVTSRRATAIGTGTGTAAATAAGKQRQVRM